MIKKWAPSQTQDFDNKAVGAKTNQYFPLYAGVAQQK